MDKKKRDNNFKYDPAQIKVVKQIANENIVTLFEELNIMDGMKDHYPRYINGPCVLHESNNRTAFSWNYELGSFKCWSAGCHEKGSDIFSLISQLKGLSFYESIEWILIKLRIDLEKLKISHDSIDNIEFIRNARLKRVDEEKIINEKILDQMAPTQYLVLERGFSQETSDKYSPRIGNSNVTNMINRIAIPVRNIRGEIVGFTGRAINDSIIPKWLHQNFQSGSQLFNLYSAKDHIMNSSTIIITEGPFDCFKFEDASIYNSVAIFGKSLTQQQISLILSSGAFKIIIALDNDEAGKSGSDSIEEKLKDFCDIKTFVIPEGKKDIGEMTLKEVQKEYDRLKE